MLMRIAQTKAKNQLPTEYTHTHTHHKHASTHNDVNSIVLIYNTKYTETVNQSLIFERIYLKSYLVLTRVMKNRFQLGKSYP